MGSNKAAFQINRKHLLLAISSLNLGLSSLRLDLSIRWSSLSEKLSIMTKIILELTP